MPLAICLYNSHPDSYYSPNSNYDLLSLPYPVYRLGFRCCPVDCSSDEADCSSDSTVDRLFDYYLNFRLNYSPDSRSRPVALTLSAVIALNSARLVYQDLVAVYRTVNFIIYH